MPTTTENTANKEKDITEIHLDPSLKTLWVDHFHMAEREDGVCCVRLSTNLPDGFYEQSRFMTNKKSIKEFVDIICASISYYPTKEKKISRKSSKKPKPVA